MKKSLFLFFLLSILAIPWNALGLNQIIVQGHEDPESIKKAVQYYADYWKIDHMTIVVIFTHQLPNNMSGFVKYQVDTNFNTRNAIIKISKNQRGVAQKITLAHEMIHVKQYFYGELIAHTEKDYTWKNQNFPNIQRTSYHDRPWEKEAFYWEKKVFANYKEILSHPIK